MQRKMDVDTQTSSAKTAQVRVQLTTRHADLQLPDTGPILVSTGLRRFALSTLVNSLLEAEKAIPFEFLINGQFLRTTIDEFLTANGISAESALTIEYVRALIPPVHISSFQHDDWVSSVDVQPSLETSPPTILSSSYDGLLRVWNSIDGSLLAISPSSQNSHTGPIKAVRHLSPTKLVSSGNDRTIRVWNYLENPTGETPTASLTPILELYGHRSSVDSICAHVPTARILSASSDHKIGLWSTSKSSAPEPPQTLLPSASASINKRRKLSKSGAKQVSQRGPLSLLEGHTDVASSAIFKGNDPTVAYSSSWDHSVRTWDLTTSKMVNTRTTLHPILSMIELQGIQLLAAGTSARHVTLMDPRATASKVAAMTLRGHTNAVVSLAQDPTSDYSLVSGSHDGSLRIWDIRSVKMTPSAATNLVEGGPVGESVYVIYRESAKDGNQRRVGGEGIKVFDVCWDKEVGIISGGEDKKVQVNKPATATS